MQSLSTPLLGICAPTHTPNVVILCGVYDVIVGLRVDAQHDVRTVRASVAVDAAVRHDLVHLHACVRRLVVISRDLENAQ